MSFASFGLDPAVTDGLRLLGHDQPTAFQAEIIPPILAGRDVVAVSASGGGRGTASALGAVERLRQGPAGTLRAVIVVPSPERARYLCSLLDQLGRSQGHRVVQLCWGVPMAQQVRQVEAGVDVAVACPERLLDHIQRRTLLVDHVGLVILDQADRLFYMGFLPTTGEILQRLPKPRQTVVFAESWPADLGRLCGEQTVDPATFGPADAVPVVRAPQVLHRVDAVRKRDVLLHLLSQSEAASVLVFARTKHRARQFCQAVQRAGHKAAFVEGSLAPAYRRQVVSRFLRGDYRVLVATDVAGRGIDVSRLPLVVNVDAPANPEAYVYRIHRIGEAAPAAATVTIATADDESVIRQIEERLGEGLPQAADQFPTVEAPPAAPPPGEPRKADSPPPAERPRNPRRPVRAARPERVANPKPGPRKPARETPPAPPKQPKRPAPDDDREEGDPEQPTENFSRMDLMRMRQHRPAPRAPTGGGVYVATSGARPIVLSSHVSRAPGRAEEPPRWAKSGPPKPKGAKGPRKPRRPEQDRPRPGRRG